MSTETMAASGDEARRTFQDKSYSAHAAIYESLSKDENKRRVAETWFCDDTADAWLHNRMFQCADPLLAQFPEASWLTVGDGRFGKDAHYIESKGGRALATDITDALLVQGKARGFISDFKRENAEALSFADGQFDFVFCKESYHHFPRPMLALYEMLRVARKGVLLIEPADEPVLLHPKAVLLKAVKALLIRLGFGRRFGSLDTHLVEFNAAAYEEGGNYVYGLSSRDVQKAALGLNLPHVAFRGINTFYVKGSEFEKADESSATFRKMREQIRRRDARCARGLNLAAHDILAAMVFKVPMEPALRARLGEAGYQVLDLPRNPHLK